MRRRKQTDRRLRAHGFVIQSRPAVGAALWRRWETVELDDGSKVKRLSKRTFTDDQAWVIVLREESSYRESVVTGDA